MKFSWPTQSSFSIYLAPRWKILPKPFWENKAKALLAILLASGQMNLICYAQEPDPKQNQRLADDETQVRRLPDPESVIPLPAIKAPKDFSGFGDSKSERKEEIPSPFLPPKYQPPQKPSIAVPDASTEEDSTDEYDVGTIGSPIYPKDYLIPIRPLHEYSGEQRLWMPTPPTSQSIALPDVASASFEPTLRLDQPWTFINADEKRQLDALASSPPPSMACTVVPVPYSAYDFSPTPAPANTFCPPAETQSYYAKQPIETQRPWVEWWRPFYSGGIYSPAIPVFSDVNPLTPQFIVFGDYRTGVGIHRNNGAPNQNWAHRLNLEADLKFTSTERFHASMGPLDHDGKFTRLDFSNDVRFETEMDAQLNTAFFEGDLGALVGGVRGVDAPFDLPFTFGIVPLLYQNGIWMEDAIVGGAVAFPWKHSLPLNWCNYDATFFAGVHDITSPAFGNDKEAAGVVGTAWFIEAYQGYIEADYAYLNDQEGQNRDYHNFALAYSRRYWNRISNSIRFIANIGQDGPRIDRSADGGLILFENSLISPMPSNIVPYWNTFLGYGSPQSVARAGGSGGILRNTGINFETDGLTGYPTLDATGSNSFGGAVGINLLSADFRRQWAFEFAALDTYGNDALSRAPGAQYALGTRWQKAISNASIIRLDFMNGWLDNASDIYGSRIEYRWKF